MERYILAAIMVVFVGSLIFQRIRNKLPNTLNEGQLTIKHKLSVVNAPADELKICFEMLLSTTQQIDQT